MLGRTIREVTWAHSSGKQSWIVAYGKLSAPKPPTFSLSCHPVRASHTPYQYAGQRCHFQPLSVLSLVDMPSLQTNSRTGTSLTPWGKGADSRHQGIECGPCGSQQLAVGPSPRAEDVAPESRTFPLSRNAQPWRHWVQTGCQEQEASQGCSSQGWAGRWLVSMQSPGC